MSGSEKVAAVSEQSFEEDVLKSEKPTLVDFWAEWCGPCKMVAPVVEELAGDYDGRVRFTKMNVDENISLPTRYGVRGIPAMLLFKDGKVVDQIIGYVPKAKLKEMIDRHV
ncbi:MAG: thioredoxin [Deltaproteobacteria bacterium]|nr:thioredoxin [Deltaproteobacteria bacterium]